MQTKDITDTGTETASYKVPPLAWNVQIRSDYCRLVKIDRRFRGAYCHQGSKHLKIFGQFLPGCRRNIPEDIHLHTRRRNNLKVKVAKIFELQKII
jgi:hypothetical protein